MSRLESSSLQYENSKTSEDNVTIQGSASLMPFKVTDRYCALRQCSVFDEINK